MLEWIRELSPAIVMLVLTSVLVATTILGGRRRTTATEVRPPQTMSPDTVEAEKRVFEQADRLKARIATRILPLGPAAEPLPPTAAAPLDETGVMKAISEKTDNLKRLVDRIQ